MGAAARIVPAGRATIKEAAAVLLAGGLVAFPTETVYGLGADATSDAAVARLFAAKGRPQFNPLIVHVADFSAARRLAEFNDDAQKLAQAFWPGPLTLVLRRSADCPVGKLATARLDTVALRVPAHPVAREILTAFGGSVAAPSANRSGHVSPTTAEHVAADLAERVDLIIDGGPCPLGVESTILACIDGISLLRPGAVTRRDIADVMGWDRIDTSIFDSAGSVERMSVGHSGRAEPAVIAPGMLLSHYAPRATLRINATEVAPGEALLAFGSALPRRSGDAGKMLNLSDRGDLEEAAANLFAYLRRLDKFDVATIAVAPIPEEGLGEAINDRLRRAAAPRAAALETTGHPGNPIHRLDERGDDAHAAGSSTATVGLDTFAP